MKDLSDGASCTVPGLCVVLGLLRGVAGGQGLAVILQEVPLITDPTNLSKKKTKKIICDSRHVVNFSQNFCDTV